jgi:hypothetical protein
MIKTVCESFSQTIFLEETVETNIFHDTSFTPVIGDEVTARNYDAQEVGELEKLQFRVHCDRLELAMTCTRKQGENPGAPKVVSKAFTHVREIN